MGAMLREYWLPACRAAKVEPEGAPEAVSFTYPAGQDWKEIEPATLAAAAE